MFIFLVKSGLKVFNTLLYQDMKYAYFSINDFYFLNFLSFCLFRNKAVGYVIAVGNKVKHLKVGDKVGAGYQGGYCARCDSCKKSNE